MCVLFGDRVKVEEDEVFVTLINDGGVAKESTDQLKSSSDSAQS